eukprot:Skav215312  [mRNA]  locus=scaffold2444:68092:70612:- [translate_table: standard]
MPFAVQCQQHAELSIEGLEQRQLEQPGWDAAVKVSDNDRPKELPFGGIAVQNRHGLVLRHLPENAQAGGQDRG